MITGQWVVSRMFAILTHERFSGGMCSGIGPLDAGKVIRPSMSALGSRRSRLRLQESLVLCGN